MMTLPGWFFTIGWGLMVAALLAGFANSFGWLPVEAQLYIIAASLIFFGLSLIWPRRWSR